MPNFTPGKWVKHGDFIIGNTVCLAQVLSVHEHEDDAERNRIEKTANARLIASAPEMYSLLMECADELDAVGLPTLSRECYELIDRINGKEASNE